MEISKVPEGDVLVICGDVTGNSIYAITQLKDFNNWVDEIAYENNYKGIWLCPGNHDELFDQDINLGQQLVPRVQVLHHNYLEFEGLNIWFESYQPEFMDWGFNRSDLCRKELFKDIPENTDILISHAPRYGILDKNKYGKSCGDKILGESIDQLKQLKYHIFGHIHDSYGTKQVNGITYVNCSVMDDDYNVVNKPMVLDI